MAVPLRALILEARAADAELVTVELRRAGFALDWQWVDSEASYVAALESRPDIILSDYDMVAFTALEALRLLHHLGHAVPFIVISGTIGEEMAVECLKA